MGEVKLYGNWSSPFTYRVIWALAIKGIPYEYVEEDLSNKSPLLLHYNPIHKKVPVLVHGGKPICESTLILEYIDETWPQNPLFPADPLDRAAARFWIRFAEDKGPATWRMFCSDGEEHLKAKQESLEMLQIVEERGIGEGKFFGGETIGIVDLVYGIFGDWLGVIEEVIGEKLVEADSFPRLHAWIRAFLEAPMIRENRPDRDRMVVTFKALRERLLKSTSQ
ncbi:glutathione transferase GST 23-like [Cucurbita pepo subsp. pepo]|uniref:glutathione transferase GST 23-like n=1 Tax=Cucurbita pepo subsp. pepo TaxID=3664 RepID=UPI000C9D2972|nr:glutathione transferase GST 23-like [Cucurbita pepo subsp. pepo]